MSAGDPSLSLRQPRLLFLFAAIFLAYANISVFFQFYAYLGKLPIDPSHYGLIIGAFSAVSLLVRPLVIPFFHTGNALRGLYAGTLLVIASLASYSLAGGFWSLMAVRIFHGLAFVVLGTALMTLTVEYVPRERSGQFFGLLSVVVLVPNTLVPPLLPPLMQTLGGFPRVLLLFAGLTVLVFPFIRAAGRGRTEGGAPTGRGRLTRAEIAANLGSPAVWLVLSAMLTLYCGHALVFFFLDGYGRHLGFTGTGFFLTLATAAEIGVRLVAGSTFDRLNKGRLTAATLTWLALGYVMLAYVPGREAFYLLGAVLGLGWGVAMPVFNGLMFDLSAPRFRAFNTNLGMQMFQAGFFLGPFIGAPVVVRWGFPALYILCAALSLAGAGLILFLQTLEAK